MSEKKLYAFTLEDGSFCWGMVVIAESSEQADELLYQKRLEEAEIEHRRNVQLSQRGHWLNGYCPEKNTPSKQICNWEQHELEGFVFEAGGNG